MSEQPYDPYIPSGQTGGASRDGNQRTAALQAEIDSTVNVMRNNINKVSERGERLDSLQDKTDNLAVSAQGFRRGANRVRKQMWWKDMKMRMCLIIGIIILLVIIIVPSAIRPRCVFDEMTLEACEASDNEARVLYHFATIPLVCSNPSDTTICSDCT
ncbi:hypothetical protein D6C84_00674 [Aureobasidium pullulans]|uniref:V-SNARE coiled-coil homology domain-containing protein n=1 Tax=Aureobasidium pullulans TaxID=5580 RepID=A0A4S8X268_AURPU|nr:hypothetical protein D6D25_05425 [Aureobasidium pullulans]THW82623.1 hypothetical protein D6D17_09413 [Aureobasidium pullulans]THX57213.1 hypothetical protein D6D06_03837 [Aureobasidium pullulans]THY59497.1 hypothetical protein D6C99_01891 [Aureobasidium pullulans]THZ88730.1 hypothetical protein D6C84_00674 [Aureobasidium pullulans]